MQFDDKFFQNYKELIIGGLIILICAFFGISKIAGAATKVQKTVKDYNQENFKLKEVTKELENIEQIKKEMMNRQSKIKPVFSQKNAPEDSIASFGGMFEDIIDYVKLNGIMLRSVEYKINPPEDPIYSAFPVLYNVCNVNLFIIGTYTQMEGFLRDISMYPYFINIANLNIEPYEKNKEYLLIKVSITLYSKKQQGVNSLNGDM